MNDELDRLLSRGDDIVPSTGFTDGVMTAVRAAAHEPPPLPFPWKRAWPVLIGGLIALTSLAVGATQMTGASPGGLTAIDALVTAGSIGDWIWTVAGLVLSAGVIAAARHPEVWLPRLRGV